MKYLRELRDLKAELTVVVALSLLVLNLLHSIIVTAQLLGTKVGEKLADSATIDAFARLLGDYREGALIALFLGFGYVVGKRFTSKPDVIQAEADADIRRQQAGVDTPPTVSNS